MTTVTDSKAFAAGGEHAMCRVRSLTPDGPWECIGMHCAKCGKPCGAQGHSLCWEDDE